MFKKSMKIPKGYSQSDKIMGKRQRTNNDLQSNTQKTNNRATPLNYQHHFIFMLACSHIAKDMQANKCFVTLCCICDERKVQKMKINNIQMYLKLFLSD